MQTLQSTTVRGDVSVCIVPANVGYLFIYILVCVPREKEMAHSLDMSLCRTMSCMSAWESLSPIWDMKCAAEGIIHLPLSLMTHAINYR